MDTFGNTEPDKFGNKKIAIGALHVLHEEPAFANAKCMSTGHMYTLPASVIKQHLKDPQVGQVRTLCTTGKFTRLDEKCVHDSIVALCQNVWIPRG